MNLFTIFLLVAASQGIISGVLFITLKRYRSDKRQLAFIIILLSMALLNLVLMESGIRYHHAIFNYLAYTLPMLIVMPVGPLLYSYVSNKGLSQRHFYSTIVDLVPYIAGVLVAITGAFHWRAAIDQYNIYADSVRWLSITIYVAFSLKKVFNQQNQWYRNLVAAFAIFQIIWLVHLLPYLGLQDELIEIVTWYPIYIPLAILVYWISINGYLVLSQVSTKRSTIIDRDVATTTYKLLVDAMENDRLYLDPEMTVAKLAGRVGVSPKTISSILNQHCNTSFNHFINTYRVEELKRRLRSSGQSNLTITGLGLECGFNSSATMQRAFRQVMKCSPREYQLKTA